MSYKLLLPFFSIFLCSACFFTPNYELEQLYGHWYREGNRQIWIKPDHSCRVLYDYGKEIVADTFRATSLGGNTLEFLKEGKVVYQITIYKVNDSILVEENTDGKRVGFIEYEKIK